LSVAGLLLSVVDLIVLLEMKGWSGRGLQIAMGVAMTWLAVLHGESVVVGSESGSFRFCERI
jgi:hypothetical protein